MSKCRMKIERSTVYLFYFTLNAAYFEQTSAIHLTVFALTLYKLNEHFLLGDLV